MRNRKTCNRNVRIGVGALQTYKKEVESGAFPSEEYTFAISEEVLQKLY